MSAASGDVFYLDTAAFDAIIENSKKLAKRMFDLKEDLDRLNHELMTSWAGKGRNTYEKKYHILEQQFGDLTDELYQISEDLLKAEETYIQADTDKAKSMDGRTSRY